MSTPTRTYEDWIDEVYGWMDLSAEEEEFCRRVYELGTSVRSAIDAIRDMREAEEEREERYEDFLDNMTPLQRISHYQMMRGR